MLSTPLERRQGRLPPPFVSVPGLPNLRDIGGYELPSHLYPPGSSIRKGVLYRSASPHACPPTSLLRLRYELDIRNVFDLRSGPEAAKRGAGAAALDGRLRAAGIKRVWAPVYAKQDTTGLDRISRMRLYGQQGTDVGTLSCIAFGIALRRSSSPIPLCQLFFKNYTPCPHQKPKKPDRIVARALQFLTRTNTGFCRDVPQHSNQRRACIPPVFQTSCLADHDLCNANPLHWRKGPYWNGYLPPSLIPRPASRSRRG